MCEKPLGRRSIICILGLIFLLALSNIVACYTFTFLGQEIIYSVFIYPFVFLAANMITRDSGPRNTVLGFLSGVLVQILLFLVLNLSGITIVEAGVLVASTFAFLISQFINTFLYTRTIFNKPNYAKIFGCYAVAILMDSFIFLLYLNDGFPYGFLIYFAASNILRLAVVAFVSLIELRLPMPIIVKKSIIKEESVTSKEKIKKDLPDVLEEVVIVERKVEVPKTATAKKKPTSKIAPKTTKKVTKKKSSSASKAPVKKTSKKKPEVKTKKND